MINITLPDPGRLQIRPDIYVLNVKGKLLMYTTLDHREDLFHKAVIKDLPIINGKSFPYGNYGIHLGGYDTASVLQIGGEHDGVTAYVGYEEHRKGVISFHDEWPSMKEHKYYEKGDYPEKRDPKKYSYVDTTSLKEVHHKLDILERQVASKMKEVLTKQTVSQNASDKSNVVTASSVSNTTKSSTTSASSSTASASASGSSITKTQAELLAKRALITNRLKQASLEYIRDRSNETIVLRSSDENDLSIIAKAIMIDNQMKKFAHDNTPPVLTFEVTLNKNELIITGGEKFDELRRGARNKKGVQVLQEIFVPIMAKNILALGSAERYSNASKTEACHLIDMRFKLQRDMDSASSRLSNMKISDTSKQKELEDSF